MSNDPFIERLAAQAARVHAHRIAGRHRHHCHSGGAAVARIVLHQGRRPFRLLKSNLHQLGIALTLYVSQAQGYPSWLSGSTYWDAALLPQASQNRSLFRCPANLLAPPWTNSALPNQSYDYNMSGSALFNSRGATLLGLDASPAYRHENQVTAPSDMIAICDATNKVVGGDHDQDDYPSNLLAETIPRHNLGLNAVFCDAHVEYGLQAEWLLKTDGARQRWNYDHQSHPETWANNP